MSTWQIALGNLAPSKPKPTVAPIVAKKLIRPTYCPHCGAPMKKPDGRKLWTEQEDSELVRLLEEGNTHQAIAQILGRPYTSIRSRIVTLKLLQTNAQSKESL